MHRLIPRLAAIDREHPVQRKLLVSPDPSYGSELLACLARQQGGWIGWEVTTPRQMAASLAVNSLCDLEVRTATTVEVAELCDIALERAISAGSVDASIVELAHDAGTREAICAAVQEVRMGAVSPTQLYACNFASSQSLGSILEQYEITLAERRLADQAWILRQAIRDFDNEFTFCFGDGLVFLAPSWSSVGLEAQFLECLIAHGASNRLHRVDVDDEKRRRNAPEFFHASSTDDELLAVLRDVLARGARFDDVEIACTNVDSYGVALESICRRTRVNATLLKGIPLSSTRVGRAIGRWFEWLESGFNADVLRRALDAGDFLTGNSSSAAMARELRKASVGWGRDATRRAARRLFQQSALAGFIAVDEDGEAPADSADSSLRASVAAREQLSKLLSDLLEIAPPVRDATDAADPPIMCETVAEATLAVLERMDVMDDAELSTISRVRERLDAIAAGTRPPMPSRNALAFVRMALRDLRAWTGVSATPRPRRACGGHLHLTDIAHAGTTGRRLLYIVGLDADSVAGPVVQSSLLPDSVRAEFPQQLRTTAERRRIRSAQIHAALTDSTAELTLSYATSVGAQARAGSAAHEFLDMWRHVQGTPAATYDEMRAVLGEPRSAVPRVQDTPVDARDVWLQLLPDPANIALLRDAEKLVRKHRPQVASGLDAIVRRVEASRPTEWHGMVPDAALNIADQGAVSPSSLEAFAACPMRWFYRYALGAYPPRDIEFREGRWLDAAQRGALLHEVYEKITRARLHEQSVSDPRTLQSAVAILDVAADRWREKVPPPGDAAFRSQLRMLDEEIRYFLVDEHARWTVEPWQLAHGELRFGDEREAHIELTDGTKLALRGRVDRVDRTASGIRVIDYKTGRADTWDDSSPFDGGRRLQHALYAVAVSQLLDEPVQRVEYRFPTTVGGGTSSGANSASFVGARELVTDIVGEMKSGRFLPTFDSHDCEYCDYASVCRSTPGVYGPNSPRARWAKGCKDLDEFAGMRAWRAKE